MEHSNNTQNTPGSGRPMPVWLRILIPAAIVVAVAVIFFVKNNEAPAPVSDPGVFALDATDDFDFDEILSLGLPVMIDFGSDSCEPCKQMAPALAEVNAELSGKAIVKFVDVWKNPDAAEGFPLRVIPTQFFFDKDGNAFEPPEGMGGFAMYYDNAQQKIGFTAHEGYLDKESMLAVFKEMGIE